MFSLHQKNAKKDEGYSTKIDLKKQGVKRKSNRLKIRYNHRLLRNFKSLFSIAKQIAYLESQFKKI
jgi:hypothetical protein